MSEDRELIRRVSGHTAGLVGLVAGAAWLLGGADEALGALAGGCIAIADFAWLAWSAGVALGGAAPTRRRRLRTTLWVAASCARFGVVGLAIGLAAAQGWVGLAGFLAALTALPVTAVAEGLRAARVR